MVSAEAVVCVVADRLREILADCPRCHGNGQVSVVLVAHRMTHAMADRHFPPPHIELIGAGSATLREPCLLCWRVRQVVELAEDYQ